jgi:hypothetical protein
LSERGKPIRKDPRLQPDSRERAEQNRSPSLRRDLKPNHKDRAVELTAAEKQQASKPVPIPADFAANDEHRRLARERGLDVDFVVLKFIKHYRAEGTRLSNWDAKLDGWLLNERGGRTAPPIAAVEEESAGVSYMWSDAKSFLRSRGHDRSEIADWEKFVKDLAKEYGYAPVSMAFSAYSKQNPGGKFRQKDIVELTKKSWREWQQEQRERKKPPARAARAAG